MHPNETLVRAFYDALGRHDAEAMARCYHPDIFFTDPVFPALRGMDAPDMWRMLLGRAKDLQVTLDEAHADDEGGRAKCTARYTFTRTGRPVVNHIDALFAFRDGLIVRHYDSFPFWRWSRQALGPVGVLLGWSLPIKWKVRKDAATALEKFTSRAGR
jgi:ketosteroid isomerase-like protein